MFYDFFKFMAFQLDAEKAHDLSIKTLSMFPHASSELFGGDIPSSKKYQTNLNSMQWNFPIGLAAGLDKNAKAIDFFAKIPFGAIEVGTVTPLSQLGNDRPRLFRLLEEESLRNCMGFNNAGSEEIYQNILNSNKLAKVLGVNLGKNKVTSAQDAKFDYLKLYQKFKDVSDYLVINVSSPNTPGLRDLQRHESMREIFEVLEDERKKCSTPLFIKISPDLPLESLEGIVELANEFSLSGIIATNTTIMEDRGAGGVSGKLLTQKAKAVRARLLDISREHSKLDIIGVGGISGFDDLWDFWKSGGRAAQIYSSFIYQGPKILFDIKEGIDIKLQENKFECLEDLFSNISEIE